MKSADLHRWRWAHRWSSIACTLFLLVTCITGLPLIFSDEIARFLDPHPVSGRPAAQFDAAADAPVADAQSRYPGQWVRNVTFDTDSARLTVRLAPGADTPFSTFHELTYNLQNGAMVRDGDAPGDGTMDTVFMIHAKLFAGLPGGLFLGVMGLLLIVAIISGFALYAPYTRHLEFGTIRKGSARRRWLDTHTLIGITTGAWALVACTTGVMNTLATPLFGLWQIKDVAPILAPYRHNAPIRPEVALSRAIRAATDANPGTQVRFVTYPSHMFSSPSHYVIWINGRSKLYSRMMTPILVDARTGVVHPTPAMPWYLRAIEISRPLHFGDYGGSPLKILWAILDRFTIFVLVSGLVLLVGTPKGRRNTRAVSRHPSDGVML